MTHSQAAINEVAARAWHRSKGRDTADPLAGAFGALHDRVDQVKRELDSANLASEATELRDAVGEVDRASAEASNVETVWGDDGPHRHESTDYRREQRNAQIENARQRVEAQSETLSDYTPVVRQRIADRCLPYEQVDGQRYAQVSDEARMGLDGAEGPQLAEAMIRLSRERGFDSDVTALLSGSWGRSYAKSKGVEAAHDALVSDLTSRAATEGRDGQRRAARALAEFDRLMPAVVYNADAVAQQRLQRAGVQPHMHPAVS